MKKPFTPRKALRFLNNNTGSKLQPLISYASFIRQQDEKLRSQFSEPIASHIALANVRNGVATIVVDSATWLSKVRYLAPTIQQTLNQQGLNIQRIEFKADPDQRLIRENPYEPAFMSEKTGELLSQFADSVDNPALQSALHRLSKHGKKETPSK